VDWELSRQVGSPAAAVQFLARANPSCHRFVPGVVWRGDSGRGLDRPGTLPPHRGHARPAAPPAQAPQGRQLGHDPARRPARRRPGQPGRHPHRVPGTDRRHRARPGFCHSDDRKPRPRPRGLDDHRNRQWRTRASVFRQRPARRPGRRHRIKMLKRQMYGRANPDLLRRSVLLAD
jgi:hypothetical protein